MPIVLFTTRRQYLNRYYHVNVFSKGLRSYPEYHKPTRTQSIVCYSRSRNVPVLRAFFYVFCLCDRNDRHLGERKEETLIVLLRFHSFPRPPRAPYTPSAIFRHTQGEWTGNYSTVRSTRQTYSRHAVTPQRETRTLSHPQSNSITIRCNRIFPSRRVLTKYLSSIVEQDT